MKKLFSIMVMVLCTLTILAQEKDVTTFLGIPVDGFKAEMRKKLIEKGFTPNKDIGTEYFEGEFNGHDVNVYIVTNNNKVCRIALHDKNCQDEASIKIRFNNLCHQFEKNERYYTPEDQTIPENDDISYEMYAHSKIYQAIFYQLPKDYKIPLLLTDEDVVKAAKAMEPAYKKPVWFCIHKYDGKYYISMYYDNEYNKANGEDL